MDFGGNYDLAVRLPFDLGWAPAGLGRRGDQNQFGPGPEIGPVPGAFCIAPLAGTTHEHALSGVVPAQAGGREGRAVNAVGRPCGQNQPPAIDLQQRRRCDWRAPAGVGIGIEIPDPEQHPVTVGQKADHGKGTAIHRAEVDQPLSGFVRRID